MKDNNILQVGEPASAALPSQTIPSQRILVVEDDSDTRQLSAAALVRSGYRVDAAEDGAAGWEALQAEHYDLVVTDNNMPKVTGVELIKMLRGKHATLPVIMAAGAIPKEELSREPRLQLAAMLLKPFTIEELIGTVKRVLHTSDHAEICIPAMTGAVGQSATFAQGHQ